MLHMSVPFQIDYVFISVSTFIAYILRYRMGDGAREISKAGEAVFGQDGSRLMCWPHTYRNLVTKMAALRNHNQILQQQLLQDIQNLQWSCHSERHLLSSLIFLKRNMLMETIRSKKRFYSVISLSTSELSGALDLMFSGRLHFHVFFAVKSFTESVF